MGQGFSIRRAEPGDIGACVAMIEAERRRRATWAPLFWRPAGGAAGLSHAFFSFLQADPQTLFLVAETGGRPGGFVIVRPTPAPPVYAPGPTATIDDFCVAQAERWPDLGRALLEEARRELRRRGVAQLVAVSPDRDRRRKALFRAAGLELVSTWWSAAA